MLTHEIFYKFDLNCVYGGGVLKTQLFNDDFTKGFYVYLIENNNKYYIGLTSNLSQRITSHKKNNTNNINDMNSCVYILEKLNNKKQMRDMEYIWIVWFCLNAECVNNCRGTYKIRNGLINEKHIFNTNYYTFCKYNYINGVRLLTHQTKTPHDELNYFGRNL